MYDIRSSVSIWAKQTYEESLSALILPDELKTQAYKSFGELGLLNKKVNGYSCEQLPKTEEGRAGIKIIYSEVFHSLIESNDFSPTTYLVKLIDLFLKAKEPSVNNSAILKGLLARGLRTLTSLLREPDFAEILGKQLIPYGHNVRTNLNPRQDSSDHTDVLLLYQGQVYRIWLFQFSSRGLPHDIERITGRRGTLPDGIHVLCPLHTEYAIEYENLSTKIENIEKRIDKYNDKLKTCSATAIAEQAKISEKLSKYESDLSGLKLDILSSQSICAEELDILEGWYFYSSLHIKRIADMLSANVNPDNYCNVKEILTGPEKYLAQPRIFIK